jgi:indoleamine 2,3-dioxygenase
MNFPYTDNFFSIDELNGFLPLKDPLSKLPERYEDVQCIITNLPDLISKGDLLESSILLLENKIELVKQETDIFIIQALYRAYTFLSSAYLLEPSNRNKSNGKYGIGRNILPTQLTQPLEWTASKLDVYPWLDYHYAYSLGNYVKKNPSAGFEYTNLDMACKFSGTSDEIGFIMVHVDINSHSPNLIKGIKLFNDSHKLEALKLILNTMEKINERRKTMWSASNPSNYNNFRAFIMGIKGNTDIFGPGVKYEGSTNTELRTYRGQSGSQDDIIPTVDIFTGLFKYYPNNILTQYLLDMRTYRPKPVQNFLSDLEKNHIDLNYLNNSNMLNDEELKLLYKILEEIHNFRNGHWMFVQKYIMANTKYNIATGGTPITTWIPNQIEAVIAYMRIILNMINDENFKSINKLDLDFRFNVLVSQIDELKKANYDVNLIYNCEGKLAEN